MSKEPDYKLFFKVIIIAIEPGSVFNHNLVKSLYITHLDYITLEKQLQQDKQPHIFYQQSQEENFAEQLIVLGIIQNKLEELQKIRQHEPLYYQRHSETIHKILQKHRKRHDQLQILEQSIQNQMIQSRQTKTSNPLLLAKYPGPPLISKFFT